MPSSRQTRLPGLDPEGSSGKAAPAKTAGRKARTAQVPSVDPVPETLASSAADARTLPEPIAPDEAHSTRPLSLRGKTVYVVDSHSLIFQVFHALPEMTSPRGEPVGAVFGFARDMMFLLEQKKPDYLFCAFDMPGPTFRDEMFAGYKEHRTEMPDDLVPQIASIERMLAALAIPVLGAAGYEADDVLATVACITAERGGECILVTGDKDCRQLLGERVKMFNIRKNQVFDAAALAADWGVRPEQVVDYQALVGDPVDTIPGVPLIGPKLARELLQKYRHARRASTAHVEEIPGGKRRENLRARREQAFLSRELVRLNAATPGRHRLGARPGRRLRSARAADLFWNSGSTRSREKMRSQIPPTRVVWKHDYQTIDTPDKLAALVAEMGRQPVISIDTETTSTSAAMGRDRRLFVRLRRRARLITCPSAARPASRGSIRRERSRRCGPCSKTRTSARSGRTSSTT